MSKDLDLEITQKVSEVDHTYDQAKNSSSEIDVESATSRESLLEPDVAELPKVVREIVPLEDDPTIPVLTFRYFILSIIFIVPGAFIDTMNSLGWEMAS